jgi:phage recombination protein Bet
MSNELVKQDQFSIDLQLFREQFCKSLSEQEAQFYYNLCVSLQANPFKREIWSIKSGNNVNYIVGRDLYRRIAQEQPNYDGHIVNAIYSKDVFRVVNGQVHHESADFNNRGQLVGAYCIVRAKNRSLDYLTICNLSEYKGNTPIWNSKTETMIKKVAEAQALRGAFQGLFAGTYEESEAWQDAEEVTVKKPSNKIEVAKVKPSQKLQDAANMIIENMPNMDLQPAEFADDFSLAYDLCEGCKSLDELAALWSNNKNWQTNDTVKAIFSSRKKELTNGN